MAEFPDLGGRCSVTECCVLDYLPVECKACHLLFCKSHYNKDSHKCKVEDQPSINPCACTKDASSTSFGCTFESCMKRELTEIRCSECKGQFCLQHRHCVDHKCSSISADHTNNDRPVHSQPSTAVSAFTQPIQSSATKPNGTGHSLKCAVPAAGSTARARYDKLRLMKVKSRAVGEPNIPIENRVYLEVLTPYNQQTLAVYVSQHWTVSRVMSSVARLSGMTNDGVLQGKTLCLSVLDPADQSERRVSDVTETVGLLQWPPAQLLKLHYDC